MILELKDKFEAEEGQAFAGTGVAKGIVQDAIEALTALGYAKTDAARAVRSVAATEDMTVEELLKQSLKEL